MHDEGRIFAAPSLARIRVLIAVMVGAVFGMNIVCAFQFIFTPARYMYGFEISGVPGVAIVQSMGILFLMWNLTYPAVIVQPAQQRVLFIIVLLQQMVGIAGETWLFFSLPAGHDLLAGTALRFIFFDSLGFVVLILAFLLSLRLKPRWYSVKQGLNN